MWICLNLILHSDHLCCLETKAKHHENNLVLSCYHRSVLTFVFLSLEQKVHKESDIQCVCALLSS